MDVGTEENSFGGVAGDLDAETLCDALEHVDLKRLTIRKASCAYLTNMRPRYVLERIAKAVPRWSNLVRSFISLICHLLTRDALRNHSTTRLKPVQD
jgi:hypothetical protein